MKVPPGHVTVAEACDLLGISRDQLMKRVAARRLACYPVTDGKRPRWSFRRDDIDAHLAARRIEQEQRDIDRANAAVPIREVRPRPRASLDLPEAKRYA